MLRVICGSLFVATALAIVPRACGQSATTGGPVFDFAITYTAERAKIASVDCGCFWLHGGSFSGAATFYRGFGIAVDLTGDHAANIQPAVDLDKVTFLTGPRYTLRRGTPSAAGHFADGHSVGLFGEALFGGAHGFNTVFPGTSGVKGAASSFAYQIGGGMDWSVTKNVGVRVVEADYVHSALPNNDSNTQNDLRLAAGVVFHFK